MACSRNFYIDIPELLNDIIQYLQNDFTTLYSCILVNRLWCRLAIPLLWEDPFSAYAFRFNHPYSIPSHKFRFLEIYLHYLNDGDKRRLLKVYKINSLNSCPLNTLFNYPSFIKRLNVEETFYSVNKWVIKYYGYSNQSTTRFILELLFKVFIENKADIHIFEVGRFNIYELNDES